MPSSMPTNSRIRSSWISSHRPRDCVPPRATATRAPGRQELELCGQASSVLEPARLGLVDQLAEVAEALLYRLQRLLHALARLCEEVLARGIQRLLGDAPDGLRQLLLERLEACGGRGGAGAGVGERAARGIELGVTACELVAERQLEPVALDAQGAPLGQHGAKPEPAGPEAHERRSDGNEDRHEDQAT